MSAALPIHLVVITPERQVLDERTEAVVIPAHDGELGILRDRAALMCELGIGQLRYGPPGQAKRLFVDGGFAQIIDNSVTVLTNRALPAEEITAETVRAFEREVDRHTGIDAEARTAREAAQRRLSVVRGLKGE